MHVLGNSWRGMQCNCCPHSIDLLLGDIVLAQESSGTVRPIHLEAVCLTAILRRQSHVVEHSANVKQLGIKLESPLFSGKGAEIIHTGRVVEQQWRLGIPDQFRGFPSKFTVGYRYP